MGNYLGPEGAASSLTASEALGIVLGGVDPEEKPRPSQQEYLDTCDMPPEWSEKAIGAFLDYSDDSGRAYSECGRIIGKLILDFLREHPECENMPAESKYDWTGFDGGSMPPIVAEGLWDTIVRVDPERGKKLNACQPSGFMVGWAINAARTAMGWGPVANPALITIGGNK
jgi:hypothetical protein